MAQLGPARHNPPPLFWADAPLFRSFLLGGFECSTHRRGGDHQRLDLIAATRHGRFATEDYARLADLGIKTARDGIRWHRIEETPGRYDFASVVPQLRAARQAGVQVIWDLFHYGWPDDLDIFTPAFVDRFAAMARAFAAVLADETDGPPWITPVNEISYLAWAGGDTAEIFPFAKGRGHDLKAQLIRASIAATEAVWSVAPGTRLAQVEPIFNVIAHPDRPHEVEIAERYRLAQYEAWDMLSGRLRPDLGGHPRYLDAIGVNYYPWNQWIFEGPVDPGASIEPGHPGYRPLRAMLAEVAARYRRPLFIAETGTEGDDRPAWFAHIASEVVAAIESGVPVEGVCLYPIVNFPGWTNDRHCQNGLWDSADDHGHRPIFEPLRDEIERQVPRFATAQAGRRGSPP